VLWWALGLFDHRWRDLAHWHLLLPGALPGSNTSSRTEGLGAGQDVLGSGTFPGNFTPGHLGIAGAPGAARNSSTECSAVGENCTSTKCCKDPSLRCFEKDRHWAGCRASCSPGTWEGDPPQHRTHWSCLLPDINGLQGLISSSSTTLSPSSTPPFEPWPDVIAEGGACRFDDSTSACAAGLTCELGLSGASTCVRLPASSDQALNGVGPDRVSTKTTGAVTTGDKTLMLERQTGIVVGSDLMIFNADGTSERGVIVGLEDGTFTLESPLDNSYPSGSDVVVAKASAEPEEEPSIAEEEEVAIKRTNHFTTLRNEISQGTTQLPVMSFRGFHVGDIIFIEGPGTPGEAREITAVVKTAGDFKLVIRTPISKAYPREATVTQLEGPEPATSLGPGQEW